MADTIPALIIPFAGGFVVQRFLEILDPFTTAKIKDPNKKRIVMAILSIAIGWSLAAFMGIHIFEVLDKALDKKLGQQFDHPNWDIFFSGIFISAGTEGFNSLLKFANYKKEASKAEAADKKSQLKPEQLALVNPQS